MGAFSAVAVATTWPLVLRLGDALPVSRRRRAAAQYALLLAWDADRLLHGLQGWWNLPIFYPYTHALAFSENLLGIALFTAPIQWLTGNPVVAYNVAYLGVVRPCGRGDVPAGVIADGEPPCRRRGRRAVRLRAVPRPGGGTPAVADVRLDADRAVGAPSLLRHGPAHRPRRLRRRVSASRDCPTGTSSTSSRRS